MLTINHVPVQCINEAAIHYQVPAPLIVAVLKTENGGNGMAVKNKNSTYDLGVMQINSAHWPSFYHYQINEHTITKARVLTDACFNVWVGTWLLHEELTKSATIWHGVGNYHSHTISHNVGYANLVEKRYQHLLIRLSA